MRIFTGPKLQFRQLLFSPDGSHLAGVGWSPSGGHAALVWAVHGDGEPLYELTNSDRSRPYLSEVVFSPNGRRVLVNHETEWHVYILDTGEELMDSELSNFRPRIVSDSGKWAVRYEQPETNTGEVRVVAMENDEDRWRIAWTRFVRFPLAQEIIARAEGTRGFAGGRLSSSGSRLVLVYDSDGQDFGSCAVNVRVIDTMTGADVCDWHGELPDSAFLKLVGPQNQVVMHDGRLPSFHVIDTGSCHLPPLSRTSTSRMDFTDAAFSPDGRWHATTTNDTTVTMWDATTWQPVRRYGWKIGRLRAVAFAPDGLTCAAGSDTGKVVLFDVDV